MRLLNFHAIMTSIAAAVIALSAWGMHVTRINLSPGQVVPRLALLVVLLAGAAFYRWRKLPKATNLIVMAFWGILISNLLLLPMYILARRQLTFCDAELARWDAWLGIEVPDVFRGLQQVPSVARLLETAYGLLIVMITLAIMVPPLCGRMDKAKEFALASVAAAAISFPVFAFLQALGPWSHYGYDPSPPQAESMKTLLALKTDDWFELNLGDLNGLICFPSFHTILALLTAAVLWPIPYLRWPSAVVAALIVLSTVTTGWHYIVDVLAGILMTPVAIALARGVLRLEARVARQEWNAHEPPGLSRRD
jgi:membrane-associated phospholipid phosphatase